MFDFLATIKDYLVAHPEIAAIVAGVIALVEAKYPFIGRLLRSVLLPVKAMAKAAGVGRAGDAGYLLTLRHKASEICDDCEGRTAALKLLDQVDELATKLTAPKKAAK